MFLTVVGLFFLINVASLCEVEDSVDIYNGKYLQDGSIISDGILYPPHLQLYHRGSIRGCICEIKRCIRKCCKFGYAMINSTCAAYNETEFMVELHDNDTKIEPSNDFHFFHNIDCGDKGFYNLLPFLFNDDVFYLQEDGQLYMPFIKPGGEMHQFQRFCVDTFFDEDNDGNFSALLCFAHTKKKAEPMYSFGMIISMPFLLLTFLVYAVLPERNLHGKSLMCYVITLFGAYLLLVFIQLYPDDLNDATCKSLGMFCLFFFMVSFFWMNVMSIDIWWAFSGLRGFSGSKREAEHKRFLLYCAYAWGVPFLQVIVVLSFTLSTSLPKNVWYHPGMGDGQCWFRAGVPTLVYFYGPMATLIIANIVFFCVTAYKIKQVQQDTSMLRKDESKKHSYENDKQRFNLYLKLMLAMGVNWAMEIISWVVDWQVGHVPPAVWYITDFCNALYGVFIFFIFVFKRNIWKLLKRRYYMIIGKPHLARSMTQTAYSPRTTGSTLSHTTVATDKSFVNDSSVLTSEVA